jgi:glycosyltransferase involved in cell wall biosynthesis
VTVLALRYPPYRARYQVAGARVIAIGGGAAARVGRLAVWRDALRAIRAERFDLVHAVWAHEPGFLATLTSRKTIVSLFGGELANEPSIRYGSQRHGLDRTLIRLALGRATVVTAGSRWYAKHAERMVEPQRLRVTPLGVDRSRFSPAGPLAALDGEIPVLQVGSLVPVKDQLTLLDAVRRLDDRRLHVHIVGDGPLRCRLAAIAGALGVPAIFHGAVAHGQLPAHYRASRLHVISSRFESQSLVALEAAACGIAGVGTSVGVLGELGMPLAPPGDPVALAAAMRAALDDDELGNRLRERSERYALDRASAGFAALYEEIAG